MKHDPSGRLQRACSRLHLVVHLFGAVEHVDHDAQRAPQVLGGLGFAGPGGPRGGATHGQMEGLSQGDVASAEGNGLLLMAEVKGDTVLTTVCMDGDSRITLSILFVEVTIT